MTGAIWLIVYDLQRDREAEYLEWFHEVHIPEKLARPGYDWASHYRIERDGGGDAGYIALFGSKASRVFYNPSPAQLKPTQPPETRDMMTCRKNARSLILAGEWAVDGEGSATDCSAAIDADIIALGLCDTGGNDEDFGAWLAQVHLPAAMQDRGCVGLRKYLASRGGAKHVILHERADLAPPPLAFSDPGADEWTVRVEEYADHPLGLPERARLLRNALS